jgi:hypothetical protein
MFLFLFFIVTGDKIDYLAVQIRNSNKQPTFSLPDASSLKYSVKMAVHAHRSEDIIQAHVCKVPMLRDAESGGLTDDPEGVAADKFFFFSNLSFPVGEHCLKITILDGTREVKSYDQTLKVCACVRVCVCVCVCACVCVRLCVCLLHTIMGYV